MRLLHFLAVRDQPFVAQPIEDSQEYDRWARAILAGHAPADAFFQAPLYPYLLAAIYTLAGARPNAVYLFQIALSIAGCWAIYRAGRLLLDRTLGLSAAALFASYPLFVLHDVQLLKESLAVTLTAFLLWTLIAAEASGRLRHWAAAGAVAGLLSLLRENTLLLLPPLALLAWRPDAAWTIRLRRAGVFFVAAALPLIPVAWRNARAAGGGFMPTTFNAGVSFYIGNHEGADGTYQPLVPGKQIPGYERSESVRLAEEASGRSLRPPEVSRYWLNRSFTWVKAHPGDFVRLQLLKLRLFWSWYEWPDAIDPYYLISLSPVLRLPWLDFGGVCILALAGLWMLRRGIGNYAPVLIWVVGSTFATTIFFVFSRYRLPIVPALILLAALPLHALATAWRSQRKPAILGLAALLAVAVVAPRLPGYGPRWDLVHFNLGRAHQEAGRIEDAKREYELALRANPRDFLSYLNLGNIAARGGQMAEATSRFARAVELEPRSDDAESNLGGALLALGRLDEARAHLQRSLALNPRNSFAARNMEVLRRRDPAAKVEPGNTPPLY
ncbi:MAG: glycosyltransferase family 39 protein [Acidobacteriota bacterium]